MIVPRHVLGKGFTAPSDQIGLGMIGTGKQANGLVKRFAELPEVRFVAGSDVDQKKLDQFVNQVKEITGDASCQSHQDYHELLAQQDVDAVIVATPDHWHAVMSIDAMRAGKDVFCEKPLAHTVVEGRRMAKAAAKYDRILQTGSMQRSWEGFRKAVNLVRNGYLGEINKVIVSVGDPEIPCDLPAEEQPSNINWDAWLGPAASRPYHSMLAHPNMAEGWAQWRQFREYGGGILCDWGAHMFDIAQWGLDMDHSGPVLFVPPSDPLAKRGLKMIYDSGIEMLHEDFDRGWAVRFVGSEGRLDVSRKFLDSDPVNISEIELSKDEQKVYHSDNHYQNWIDCIKQRTKPICDAEIGHRTSSICNLANIAYRLRRPLRWDPVKEKFSKNKEANKLLDKKYRKPYKIRR